ncbi:sigma-70 family RNA polymerase sigma factor [Aeoliella mucimassa]|uniref:ECF RNA polymerase sigma factor SigW n=1 Tax=Aeoliella mucimassa TaxID=2527972 RepID=A0A518AMH5_9BACT|nr:sigma-70 family RNA polymerase sigma factor [Aeoliella mucimassa]QDU55906.1 ECF RNA polymerase sigma factor SigW [Aeoliella mucimassa]
MASDDFTPSQRARLFGELLAACHCDLFAFIYSLVQHHADAEDVYQQVTMLLWENFDSFEVGTNFSAWATAFAHNTARAFLRSRKRNAITLGDEALDAIAAAYNAKHNWSSTETSEALNHCLKKLSDHSRSLVERCYAQNRDMAAIAKSENRTIGAIYQAICRIRKKLFSCVQRTISQGATA